MSEEMPRLAFPRSAKAQRGCTNFPFRVYSFIEGSWSYYGVFVLLLWFCFTVLNFFVFCFLFLRFLVIFLFASCFRFFTYLVIYFS